MLFGTAASPCYKKTRLFIQFGKKTGLKSLSERQKIRCLSFAKRCLKNPHTKQMFPLNPENIQNVRQPVNFARTKNYRNSAVPYCQRLLNDDHRQEQEKKRGRKEQAEHQEREEARARREGR